MNHRKTMLSASIVAALMFTGAAFAQDSSANDPQSAQATASAQQKAAQKKAAQEKADERNAENLQTIHVVGIRNAQVESLRLKQAAASHVEIVTAEDIGKLPAKNVADTLKRLPGVNISSASASEGGFDESDRVSLRGTNPNLTQTLVDGHTIGTGDWFVLSQTQTVGRSVSYSLLPAEVVSEVVVHKTSEARLPEGGSAGTVNIVTRKPLEFGKKFTTHASVGGVYADLPGETKPQFSGLFNYKNDAGTFGIMAQAFYEQRSLQRNGQEVVGGYVQIAPDSAIAQAHPDLAGVYYPNEIGSVYFTQKRTRKGGVIDLQFKPTDDLTVNLNGFYSKLEADNFNTNYMMWASQFVASGAGLQPGYVVKNNVLTQANFAAVPGSTTPYVVYDQISRPGAASQSRFVTLDADWNVSNTLSLHAQAGTTKGEGSSPRQDVIELGAQPGGGAAWAMRGISNPINWSVGSDNSSPAASGIMPTAGWIFGEGGINAKDKEKWYQGDGSLYFYDGAFSSLQFGVRYADHTRESLGSFAQGPKGDWQNLANYPGSWSHYPGGFNGSLGVLGPDNIWHYSPSQLADFDAQFANRDPVTRFYFNDIYKVNEKDSAAYVQANFDGEHWNGNVGLRYVRTKENISYASTAPAANVSSSEGPITGSAFGAYYWNTYEHTYGKLLPSANFKFDLTDQWDLRLAGSQTLTRPNYSSLAGFVSLDDLTHTGNGGNPQLKALVSTNLDAALEWYFAPRGLFSVSVYHMDLKDYVNFADEERTYKDIQASQTTGTDVYASYSVSVPHNVDGNVKGVEVNYIQPIGKYFGFSGNYTYADGEGGNGQPLQGTSKNTWNASAYFENSKFNARVSYTYRSSFYAGVSRSDTFYMDSAGYLAASLGYTLNDWMSISLDAMNLNNPKLKYYTENAAYGKQPHAFYVNGRQYYLTLRFNF